MGRQPEVPISILLFLVAFLPVLQGNIGPAGPLPDAGWNLHPSSSDSLLVWIFLSDDEGDSSHVLGHLRRQGGQLRILSRWLNAVSVELPWERLSGLETIPGVWAIRPVARWEAPRDPTCPLEGIFPVLSQSVLDSIYGEIGEAMQALGIPQAHGLGFSGTGVRVGILDGTFRTTHALLGSSAVQGVRDFVDGDETVDLDPGDPSESATHGTALWGLVGGDLAGTYRGAAPGVDVLLARVREDGVPSRVDEDRWVAGLEWLESLGARVVLSGISFREFDEFVYPYQSMDGNTTPASRAAEEAARRGILLVTPVGNGGPGTGTLGAPADADSILSVGAVDSRGLPAAFSAVGPTADGRNKPELLAPGVELTAPSGIGDQALGRVEGTEFAAALVAGGAALMVEAYPGQGPIEVLEALVRSTHPDTGSFRGVPNVGSALVFPEGVEASPLSEVDGQGNVTSLTPQFRWDAPLIHPLGLPVTYRLQFSEDSLFRALALADSTIGTFARRLQAPLPPRSRLFWRVEARSVQGIMRSSGVQPPLRVPSWVRLDVLNDPGGTEVVEPQPEFEWTPMALSPPAGPFAFALQILSDRTEEIIQEYPDLTETRLAIPVPLPFNQPMRWRVIAASRTGSADTVTSAGPFVVTSTARPPVTILYQNFPNPFPNRKLGREETSIWFDLAEPGSVELAVFDIRGRLVRRLIPGVGCEGVEFEAGVYGREETPSEDPCVSFRWDGRDEQGERVSSGVYLLRLRSGGVVQVRRVVYWR